MATRVTHVYYTCKPGMAEAFVRAVKDCGAQKKVQAEDGCFQYDYTISCETPDTVVLIERWRDAAAVETHLQQPHMSDIRTLKETYVLETKAERYDCV